MTTVKTKKSIKPAVVVTYVIATLALIAGWFIPIFGYGQGMDTMDMMMFWYVPAIINAFFNPYLGGNLIPGSYVGSHDLPEFAEFVSRIIKTVNIQILALMLMIYLLVTVLAIIFIIPVCVGKKREKDKPDMCVYNRRRRDCRTCHPLPFRHMGTRPHFDFQRLSQPRLRLRRSASDYIHPVHGR